jgi:hypothetical protein
VAQRNTFKEHISFSHNFRARSTGRNKLIINIFHIVCLAHFAAKG